MPIGALADPLVEMVPAFSDIAGTQEKDSRALFDSAVQASVALGEAVRRSFGPNGTLNPRACLYPAPRVQPAQLIATVLLFCVVYLHARTI